MARNLLFPRLTPAASSKALSTALSLAREALAALGQAGTRLLRADRANTGSTMRSFWSSMSSPTRKHFGRFSGPARHAKDAGLSTALQQDGVLLDEEPFAEWAVARRDVLNYCDNAPAWIGPGPRPGLGSRSRTPSSMRGKSSSIRPGVGRGGFGVERVYSARGERELVSNAFERCRAALLALGLATSPAWSKPGEDGRCRRAG